MTRRHPENKKQMKNENERDRLFATEFAEDASALELVGSYDEQRELWVGANGALASGPTNSTYQSFQGGKQVDSGTDKDY